MDRADDMNMEVDDEEQEIQEDEPMLENAEDPDTDTDTGSDEEPEDALPNLHLGPPHDIYACNHCKDYVRGGVITFCGHLFCWVCLWPLLAGQENPQCPACRTPLLLHEDIIPFFGEGPNARPGDQEALAEPGGVPRPAGVYLVPPAEDRVEREINPFNRERFPWIAFIYKCAQCLKWICIVLLVLIWLFRMFQKYGPINEYF